MVKRDSRTTWVRAAGLVAVLILPAGLSACGSGSDKAGSGGGGGGDAIALDEVVSDLAADVGIEEAEAECFLGAYEKAEIPIDQIDEVTDGDAPDDAAVDQVAKASQEAIACMPEETLTESVEAALTEDADTVRASFTESFRAAAPDQITEEQANCVFDEISKSEAEFTEIMQGVDLSTASQAVLQTAATTCELG